MISKTQVTKQTVTTSVGEPQFAIHIALHRTAFLHENQVVPLAVQDRSMPWAVFSEVNSPTPTVQPNGTIRLPHQSRDVSWPNQVLVMRRTLCRLVPILQSTAGSSSKLTGGVEPSILVLAGFEGKGRATGWRRRCCSRSACFCSLGPSFSAVGPNCKAIAWELTTSHFSKKADTGGKESYTGWVYVRRVYTLCRL